MKKIYLLICLAFSVNAFSQAEFGLKAGFHQANMDGDNLDNTDPILSPAIAAFAKLYIGDNFSFQPELQYGTYGSKTITADETGKITMSQINVPLKFNYYTGRHGNAHGFKINIGPQIGFVIKDNFEYNGTDFDLSDFIESDDNADFSSVDIGGVFDLGYELKDSGLWLETGFFHSLNSTWKYTDGDKVRNTVGTFTVGYNFGK